MNEKNNAWETEPDLNTEEIRRKMEKAEAKRSVFAQIALLRDEGDSPPEVEKRLLEWAKESQVSFAPDQLKRMLAWTYRNWD